MADQPQAGPRAARFYGAAALLAASVLLSRVLGFAREMVLAGQLGVGPETDAYQAAFAIPDILNYFLAGSALSIAFIPFYTRARAEQGAAAGERLFGVVLGSMTLLTVAATALLWWKTDALVRLQFPSYAPETQELTVRLTRIVLPAQIFFVSGGIVRAVLMAHDRFLTQALAPLLYNLGIILGGLLLGGSLGAEGFAWGALVGAFLGPLLAPLLDARRAGLRLRFSVDFRERVFWRYLWTAAPLMFGLSLLTVDEWYDRWFGGLIGEGSVSLLIYARRLMQLPVAVVGQALATAALPTFARLWSDGRRAELDRAVGETLRVALGLSLLAGAACFAFAGPLVTLVYERGAFTRLDTIRTASLLAVFAFAVPAWIVQQIALRAFYARGDTWRPMLLSTGVALASVPLYLGMRRYGPEGLAAAGVLAMSANALLILGLARALHGAPSLLRLALAGLRGFGIGLVSGLAGIWVLLWRSVDPRPFADLLVGGTAFGAVALVLVFAVGDAPLAAFLRRFLARLLRRRS